jgi:hypothetical protein
MDAILAKIQPLMTGVEYFQFMKGSAMDDQMMMRLQKVLTPKEIFQLMKSRESDGVTAAAVAAGGVAVAACQFPIWAALTQTQRACFMDGAGNTVINPTEGRGIKNRAVETLLAAFFNGAVPTKDPCLNSTPADTPENREAAWDVLCRLLPDDQKGALRDEAFAFDVFHDPVILSDGTTYERGPLMEWFVAHNTNPSTNAQMTPDERANLTPNARLKRFMDTFNLGGSQERQNMLGGRKSRHIKSKRRMRRKIKSRRKSSKSKSKKNRR